MLTEPPRIRWRRRAQLVVEGTAPIELAVTRAPDNAMANAMLVVTIYNKAELSPLQLSLANLEATEHHARKAVALNATGFFEHLMLAVVGSCG